jgi:hypothetical protein
MKRIYWYVTAAISALGLANAPYAFANVLNARITNGSRGNRIISPDQSIGSIVSFAVAFIIVVAFLAALLYVVIGAFQWITSGGDKQKVADARNHILAAVIGLIVIALSFIIINIVMQALGLGSLTNLDIPTLSEFGQ